jgi:hypothetical protein
MALEILDGEPTIDVGVDGLPKIRRALVAKSLMKKFFRKVFVIDRHARLDIEGVLKILEKYEEVEEASIARFCKRSGLEEFKEMK